MIEHLTVGEADDVIAFIGEPCRAGLIVLDLSGFSVRLAVDFDAEFGFGTVEVYDEATDDVLAAEFETVELMIAQPRPSLASAGVCG